jgi:hypothetical protein
MHLHTDSVRVYNTLIANNPEEILNILISIQMETIIWDFFTTSMSLCLVENGYLRIKGNFRAKFILTKKAKQWIKNHD